MANQLAYGLARVYAAGVDETRHEVHVCESLEEGVNWLGFTTEEAETLLAFIDGVQKENGAGGN